MIDEEDPEGLLQDINHTCEDCGTTKLKPEFNLCYLCYQKYKKSKEDD